MTTRKTWENGPLVVSVEILEPDTCHFVASRRDPIEGTPHTHLQYVGTLFIDYNAEARAMCRSVLAGQMSPSIAADWIEDHPETWQAPGPIRDEAVAAVCERLRVMDNVAAVDG